MLKLAILLESLCALCLCCSYGDLRLRNGTSRLEGRLELCLNSTWRTVCHDQLKWNETTAAKVACRQLGFSDQGAKLLGGPMVDGTCSFPTYPKELQCTGNESALIDCTRNGTANRTCDCDQYAVVNCSSSNCTAGDVRLVDGGTQTEGRVEICQDQAWFTLSAADGWGTEEAEVVCRQLGMSGQDTNHLPEKRFGEGTGPILNAECNGSESYLSSCNLTNSGHNYNHTNDAGVSCLIQEMNGTTMNNSGCFSAPDIYFIPLVVTLPVCTALVVVGVVMGCVCHYIMYARKWKRLVLEQGERLPKHMQKNTRAYNLEVTPHQSDNPNHPTESLILGNNRTTPHPVEEPNNLNTSIELQQCQAYGSTKLIREESQFSEVAYESIHEYDYPQ